VRINLGLVSANPTASLLSIFRRIVGKDSDLSPRVFKKHNATAIFGRQDDPFPNRPLVIAAFPFGIQYLPVIHSNHIVGRGVTDNRAPIPFLLGFGLQRGKTEANKRQHNRGKEVFQGGKVD